jgi:alpha-acetolactate decarboxylase
VVDTPRQHHPFPRLAEVTSHQVETVARDIRGTVVGFWTPAIYQGIAVAGLHLHFLSEDRSIGGHLLDLAAHSGDLYVAASNGSAFFAQRQYGAMPFPAMTERFADPADLGPDPAEA